MFTIVESSTAPRQNHNGGGNERPRTWIIVWVGDALWLYIASVLFNGGDSETNEQHSQNKRSLAFVTNHLAQRSTRLDKGKVTTLRSRLSEI